MRRTLYRTAAVIITLMFVTSAAISDVLNRQIPCQMAKNEIYTPAVYFQTELNNIEKLPDGTVTDVRVAGSSFYLFTADGSQIGGCYVTDADGRISLRLPPGNYYFEEINPGDGYGFDTENGVEKTRYMFDITGDETEPIVVTVYSIRLSGSLKITKTVQNKDGSQLEEEQKHKKFNFTVTFSDGGVYNYRINGGEPQSLESGGTLQLGHGQTAIFDNIPSGVLYRVAETRVPGYTVSAFGSQGSITVGDVSCADFTNICDPEPTGSITISNEVSGDGIDLQKRFEFTAVIGGSETHFTLKNGESYSFPNVPDGTEYTVTETVCSDNNYFASVRKYTGTVVGGHAVLLPFVNYYGNPDMSGILKITKEVRGENADPNKEFAFTVDFSDGGTYHYRIDGGEVRSLTSGGTLRLKHNQTAVFDDIPGNTVYTVTETDTAGYLPLITSQSGTAIGGRTVCSGFVNVVDRERENALLRITKVLAGEYQPADADKEFHFVLTVNGAETDFTLRPGETAEFPVYTGDKYEVYEDNYYSDGYVQSVFNGSGVITDKITDVTVTNTFVGETVKNIEGNIAWVLGNADNFVIPESVTVMIKRDGLPFGETTVTPNEAGEWRYSFAVPKYDTNGNEIVYTVEEKSVDGFIVSYDGLNIINTYVPPAEIDLPVIRKAVEGDSIPVKRFEFIMRGETGVPMPEGSDGNSKILYIDGVGKAELGRISYTRPGVYTYTITELSGGENGWLYDSAVYTLTVTVTESAGRLTADSMLEKNGAPADNILFVNKYETYDFSDNSSAPDSSTAPRPRDDPPTGENTDPYIIFAAMIILSLIGIAITFSRRKMQKSNTKKTGL